MLSKTTLGGKYWFAFYRCKNWGLGKLNEVFEVTVSGRSLRLHPSLFDSMDWWTGLFSSSIAQMCSPTTTAKCLKGKKDVRMTWITRLVRRGSLPTSVVPSPGLTPHSPTSLLPPREHLIFFSSFPSVGQIVGWNLMFKWKRYGERRRNRIVDSLVDSQWQTAWSTFLLILFLTVERKSWLE